MNSNTGRFFTSPFVDKPMAPTAGSVFGSSFADKPMAPTAGSFFGSPCVDKPMSPTTDNARLEFMAKFSELLDSPERSDLSIVVGSHKFYAHHIILGLRTDFFAIATKPKHGFTESIDNTVVIEEHGAPAVWRMLTYCYTGGYKDTSMKKDPPEEDDPGALKHVRVYALADMLSMPKLKTLATQKLETFFDSTWDAKSFPGTVREAYSVTASRDTRLRRIIVDMARKHLYDLAKSGDFKNTLYDFGEFSGEIVLADVADRIPVRPGFSPSTYSSVTLKVFRTP